MTVRLSMPAANINDRNIDIDKWTYTASRTNSAGSAAQEEPEEQSQTAILAAAQEEPEEQSRVSAPSSSTDNVVKRGRPEPESEPGSEPGSSHKRRRVSMECLD